MKLHHALLALATFAAFAAPAQADTYTFSGDITHSALWDRPQGDFGGLSGYGYGSHYDVLQFTVSQSGSYDFLSTSTSFNYTGDTHWDNYTFLYQDSFTPIAPGSFDHIVNANEDLGTRDQSGFTQDLTAGATYFFVTSGDDRVEFGTYTDTITGPGSVLLPGGTTPPPVTAAVPEPSSYALMVMGLLAVGTFARRSSARRRQA